MSILHHAIPNDPYYNDVVLHLRGYDAQSGQVFKDYSKYNRQINVYGNTSHSTTQKKYGNSSIYFDGSGDYLTVPASSDFAFGTGNFTIELFCYIYSISSGKRRLFDFSDDRDNVELSSNASIGYWDGFTLFISVSNVFNFNAFNYITIIRSNLNLKIYINNVLVLNVTTNSNNNSRSFVLGGLSPSIPLFYGFIEDLRITKGIARPIAIPTQPFPNF